MDADAGAWLAEIRRLPATPDPDPLALDEATAERLLAGDLRLDQAPPGYAKVAALLAATVAAPSPAELAGKAAAFAELRTVVRAHRASTWRCRVWTTMTVPGFEGRPGRYPLSATQARRYWDQWTRQAGQDRQQRAWPRQRAAFKPRA